jgi:peptide/nickel transport system permease protein
MSRPGASFVLRDRSAVWSAWLLAMCLAAATLVPLFASSATREIGDVLATRLVPPLSRDALGTWHLFGTDAYGRDLGVRLWIGARISLFVGIVGTITSGFLGVLLGAVAGWRGGWIDRVIVAVSDTLLAVPRLVLLLVMAALWSPGLYTVIVILACTGWMAVMRLVRAEVQSVRQLPYVESARALGVPTWRTLRRHVLPNAVRGATVALTLGVGNAMLLESGLSFLGLGVQPPTASWGNMIAGGREWLLVAPWIALLPGLLLLATVAAITLLAEGVRSPSNVRSATPPR